MTHKEKDSSAAIHFIETTCPHSGLPVVSSPEFTNVNIGGDYLLTVKKIGESIVYNDSVGDLKDLKMDQYNPVIEAFCKQTGVKEPIVRIIDFRHVTGRVPLKQLKKFARYFLNQEGMLAGVVFLKDPTWLRPFINLAIRIYNPSIQAVSASDDKESIEFALQIIENKTFPTLPELPDSPEEGLYVTSDNLEELNRAFAALLWEEEDSRSAMNISPENPLGYLTETLELLKHDLEETRAAEIEEHEIRLKESERNRKRLLSLMEDNEAINLALKKNLEFQQIISEISTVFVRTTDSSFDADIDELLHKTGVFFDADRSYLFLSPDNLETVSNTHEWCSEGISPQMENIQDVSMDFFPWFKSLLQSKPFIHVPDVEKLPTDASAEKQMLLNQEIQSLLFIPIKKPGKIWGLIGFDAVKKPNHWTKEHIQGLKVVANIIGDLLQKLQNEKELQAAKDDFHIKVLEIINNVDIAMWSMDMDGNYLFMNDATEKITGYDVQDWYDNPEIWEKVYPEDDLPFIKQARNELLTTGHHKCQQKIITKQGDKKTVKIEHKLVYDSNGRPRRIDSTSTDITEIIQYQKKLEQLNEELNAFSYTISHDLRAPLRSIEGFSQVIFEDYKDKLDDTGKDYLMRIRRSAKKMAFLIDELLQLSRVTTKQLKPQFIDLSEIAESVASMLLEGSGKNTAHIEFKIEPGLTMMADPFFIKIALQNLLDNALKYSMNSPKQIIEFNNTIIDKKRAFYIRDNGAGFNMEYADKLFLPFQRLHSESEFKGTGMGLAIVKRIIDKHNGKIWAESTVGSGSTFYFMFED